MATARDIIHRSMRLIGALGSGETATDDEYVDGLTALNALLDQWWISRLAVYDIQEEAFSWASGNATRTMGSGGDFDTTLPVKLQSAAQRINSIDYPISILTSQQYRVIPDKVTNTDLITHMWLDVGPALGTLYCYPVPSANAAVRLRTWARIQNFATVADTVSMPPGYERAIVYSLAVELAPEYERPVPERVDRTAANAMRILKRHNVEVPTMVNETGYIHRNPYFNWRVG